MGLSNSTPAQRTHRDELEMTTKGEAEAVEDMVEAQHHLDMVYRDPNNINNHLKVAFEDVLGEPDSIHSIDCVWRLSYFCFNFWKRFCYIIMTTCCGICIAAQWGCEFGYIAFVHVWWVTPCFKVMEINCGCLQRIYGVCVQCCCEPICHTFSLLFVNFRQPYKH